MVTDLVTVNGNKEPRPRVEAEVSSAIVSLPLSRFYLENLHRTMQSLDYQIFCKTCLELTYREVRYRSDFQFVGRLLVCQNCGKTILEPVGTGTARQDRKMGGVFPGEQPGPKSSDGLGRSHQREHSE